MSLLTPDIGLLFWMLLSFLIVFGALAKFGFPMITGMVEKRRQHFAEQFEAADKAAQKLATVEDQARKMLEQAEKRSAEMLSAAVADSQRIVDTARAKAEGEVAARMEAAKTQIEIEKQKALGELRTTVAMISVDVAEKVLRGRLDSHDADYLATLVDEAERHSKEA